MAPSTVDTSLSAINSHGMPADLERGAVPLQDLPRLSTETQRRNGFIQSSATDLTTRIREDLDSGNYICSICTDNILVQGDIIQDVYSCRDCYNVFHFRCTKTWAETQMNHESSPHGFETWRCPMCQCVDGKLPEHSCWCGRSKTHRECFQRCSILDDCPHGKLKNCIKDCHPGPCEYQCGTSCANLPVRDVNAKRTAWDNICRRYQMAPVAPKRKLKFLAVLLLSIISTLQLFCIFYARWNTMPYYYIGFNRKYGYAMDVFVYLGGSFITAGLFYLSAKVMRRAYALFCHVLDLNDLSTDRSRKVSIASLIYMILCVAGFFTSLSFLISIVQFPVSNWSSQMKDSCADFDLRIPLNGPSTSNVLEILSAKHNLQPRTAYLAPHFSPVLNDTTAPFQWYQRLTAKSFNNTVIAVDIDIEKRLWRLSHLNDTDTQNKWLAINSNDISIHSFPAVPEFLPIIEKVIANGTFTDTDQYNKHLHIPELNLSISNHWHFRDEVVHKPFLRVFNTTGLSTSDADRLCDTQWSTSGHVSRMVMRTAKFRYSNKSKLQMCMREAEFFGYKEDPRWRFVTGVKEELFVALAIVQALRTPLEISRQSL